MRNPSIVFLGSTGAVGSLALGHLSADATVGRLSLLVRRSPVGAVANATYHVVDTVNPQSYTQLLPGHDTAICTMGVGEPSKVSKEEFKRIDHDAVLAFAQACKVAGVQRFILLGSVGADAKSRSYYLQSKGALREAIGGLGFECVTTFQPSMILTPTNRYGLSQAIMLYTWPVVSKLLLGPLSKFRGIRIEALGKAIAQAALTPQPGNRVMHWAEITALSGRP